ncbi:992_t:CDS:1, partial [Racocetra persica]
KHSQTPKTICIAYFAYLQLFTTATISTLHSFPKYIASNSTLILLKNDM